MWQLQLWAGLFLISFPFYFNFAFQFIINTALDNQQIPNFGNAYRCTQPYINLFMRTFSILAYFFIFLQGSMILLPFGFLLLTSLFTAEPLMRILILLADSS